MITVPAVLNWSLTWCQVWWEIPVTDSWNSEKRLTVTSRLAWATELDTASKTNKQKKTERK